MTPTLELAIELVRRPSVTPDDAGCQTLIAERLARLGFHLESLPFGEVSNLWARRGTQPPLLAFAGHTDVVPTGPLSAWSAQPFAAEIRSGLLYGRGAADMKGSLAAMVTACEQFLARHPHHRGSLALLVTSDEEGHARDGTLKVVEHLQARREHIDWCLVGEPSSHREVGDVIKNGRRGSLGARLTVHGRQGHIAYPDRAINPIQRFAPALAELSARAWDGGNEFFPPTTFQVSNIQAGTGAMNVIPPSLEAHFNFRYSTELTVDALRAAVESVLARHGVDHAIEWTSYGEPFLTREGPLLDAARESVRTVTGQEPALSTLGGTSDGRYIAPTGAHVVELGPVNATIHSVDEHVAVEDLDRLSAIYEAILERLLL
ncbi:MAG: succinyl-diaminopimelate desuccinylase [Gammaproteobacteria bacterium]|nr:succinyl-diaminopimelate desuccinylase [Gammaproteobacteria bacterium]NIR81657.1 succinyl-diaminopimelate desuccinylase [Gammaproteobacteria bacterium]NIR88208.1 succinyl-diaminopimelate desuccinylase [Gammaproteobacteria bacterium]NIU02769.1 succinyl-diaminopimelate desuccinylase [Gammaproteobacteria bacterium]NIV73368.1 succinyl-diaminopimelate desuccinylase [Gammaproteobacteria bacterium]